MKGGCICAVLDNNHGLFAPWPDDGWWITAGCPIHAPEPMDMIQEVLPSE